MDDVRLNQDGQYTLVVLNDAGAVESAPATLTVLSPVKITLHPETFYEWPGTTVTFNVAAQSSTPITYAWRLNGSLLPGQTNTSLTITNSDVIHEGEYTVVVTDSVRSVVTQPGKLVLLFIPVVTTPPQSQTVLEHEDVTFNVVASGTVPMGYRWRRNGRTVVGFDEGKPTLTLTNVQIDQAGRYNVIITNRARLFGILSPTAVLTVLADGDQDGMADEWETLNELDPENPTDATLDGDGDGMTNQQEYVAGTDPNDASSYLKIDSLTADQPPTTLTFRSASNKTYSVQFKESLTAGVWTILTNVAAFPSNRVETVIDPGVQAEQRIYRLVTPAQTP